MKLFLHKRRLPVLFSAARLVVFSSFCGIYLNDAYSARLQASDGTAYDFFGGNSSLSGGTALFGTVKPPIEFTDVVGTAYLFRSLDTALGTLSQSAVLSASDGASGDYFGYSVSQSGNNGLVGAIYAKNSLNQQEGAAYLFRNLNTASGNTTQVAKLKASDGVGSYYFGNSVSLSGDSGLVGSRNALIGGVSKGAVYLFRGLNTAVGTVNESAKLIASDGVSGDWFGNSVSISGSRGLIGTHPNDRPAAAYFFKNLGSAAGVVAESAKLVTSDGMASRSFGAVSISGDSGVIGALGAKVGVYDYQGAAYLYRNMDAASGTVVETAKLISSDGKGGDAFGGSVSLFNDYCLVGAVGAEIRGPSLPGSGGFSSVVSVGAAYLYTNMGAANGTLTETVKFIGVDGSSRHLGSSVSLSGDNFVIGAEGGYGVFAESGVAFTGSISSVTTLDQGNSTRNVDRISFVSRTDWVIGESTDLNQVTLMNGSAADVTGVGRSVYVGRFAGSDNNTLILDATLTANEVNIGSLQGNEGNNLQIKDWGRLETDTIRLAPKNFLSIEGDYQEFSALLAYLDSTELQVWSGAEWTTVEMENAYSLISSSFAAGYTTIQAIPEPSTIAILGFGFFLIALLRLRFSLKK